ncbi:hypothetical protein CARUB_v10018841mg [Capsella rubella]|uniref:NYN domain-containing protein n=2 Tax=Capsella rubella TaxID=81985 RepID=R0HNN0_9BRAS|nr:hypothetical protein CARUB_v10018841mg [Capsella rubella]
MGSKIIIMWDFENTQVPTNCDRSQLFSNITQALRNLGYTGEIVMKGFGNISNLPHETKLRETGIEITHVPSGKDASDKRILNAIYTWAFDDPPPCNILFITSDGDFMTATVTLKEAGYNLMVAHQSRIESKSGKLTPSKVMIQESPTAWHWPKLAFGGGPYKKP